MAICFRAVVPGDVETLVGLMRQLQDDDPWSVPFGEEAARVNVRELLRNPSLGCAWFIAEGLVRKPGA